MSDKPVITGFGAVSCLGQSSRDMWKALLNGRCGIGPITAFDPAGFPCKIAGQVTDFNVSKHIPKSYRKNIKIMSRDIELAVAAANEAIISSGLITRAIDPEKVNINPTRVGVNIGAGMISPDLVELAPSVAKSETGGQFDIKKWGKDGLELIPPLWLLKYLPNMPACHISIIHDIQGPSNSITCAEVSSLLAISEAASTISRGVCDTILAGGTDVKVNPMSLIRQCLLKRATTSNNDNPAAACRPFDSGAKGSVFGDAAGVVVLESPQSARKRGAKIFAELAGTGQSSNINPAYQHLEPDGKGLTIAIQKALADASIKAQDLDLIIPHGLGILADDLAEAKGIEAALGNAVKNIPVWPTKSMLSNNGAAAGSLDIIAACFAMAEGIIPAAKNCEIKTAGCNLNISMQTQRKNIRYVLVCGYTFGGQTAAVILKKPN
jgi:3-oxoacyl-[acyl-carrier-protein] synthase II